MKTPRLSWFKCVPPDLVANPEFVAMSSSARGAYYSLQVYGWLELAKGKGISADPAFLQHITNTTPLEWESIEAQVLAEFEVRDGKLYLPWLCEQMEEATARYRQLQKASQAGNAQKSEIANAKKTDDEDEIRIDKYGNSDEHPYEYPYGNSDEPSDGHPSGQSSASAPASPSSHLTDSAVVLPPPDRTPEDASPQNPRLTTPVVGSVAVISPSSPEALREPDPDVSAIQERCAELGWKIASTRAIREILKEGPIDEILEAMMMFDEKLSTDDANFAEYGFFADGGGKTTITVLRRQKAKEAAEAQGRQHHAIRR